MNSSSYEDFAFDYSIAQEHLYYDIYNGSAAPDIGLQFSNTFTNTILKGISAFVSRIGFLLIQVGSIPVQNVYVILLHNIVEIVLVILSYSFLGFMISFGRSSAGGWVGYNNMTSNFSNVDQAVVGYSACLLGTAQISTFVVGRIHLVGAVVITFLFCSLYQPLLMHWIWSSNGWMAKSKFMGKRVSVKDHGGDLVLHVSSAIIGLMGAIFLGRRVVKVKDLDECSLGNEMVVGTLTGYILIIIGYIVFSLPTPIYESLRAPGNYSGVILVNSIVAVGAGTAVVICLHLIIYRDVLKYWVILRCIQGGMAGLISVAAGVDVYTPLVASCIAICASIIFFFFAVIIHNTSIEDCCNLTSSLLVCGFLGTLLCPLFAQKENLGPTVNIQSRSVHFLWQFICLLIVMGLTSILSLLIFIILHYSHILRNRYEITDHRRAAILEYNLPRRGYLDRLFMIDSNTEHIIPGRLREKYVNTEGPLMDKSVKGPKTGVKFSEDLKGKTTQNTKNQVDQNISINYQMDVGKLKIFNYEPDVNSPKVNSSSSGCGDYYVPYFTNQQDIKSD